VITDVDGVRAGHWTDEDARTGCTVVLLPTGTVGAAEVRGGAPASRELEVLQPGRTVERLDAVVLTGGSAFGLAAVDGVVRWCEERGLGFPTGAGPVPIVAGLALFDLMVGDGSVRPGPDAGYAASVAASSDSLALGAVGAGTGCTVAKWAGREVARPGAIGSATERHDDLVVSALVAVNALGDRRDPSERRLPVPPLARFAADGHDPAGGAGTNTTIGVVVTNARLTKLSCHLVAQSAHDGLARAVDPAHTAGDGDAFVAAATAGLPQEVEVGVVRSLAAYAVERAVIDAFNRAPTEAAG
jgi:L-aminopeptidase/D-esterase-like protein